MRERIRRWRNSSRFRFVIPTRKGPLHIFPWSGSWEWTPARITECGDHCLWNFYWGPLGIELQNPAAWEENADDLVEEWHENAEQMPTTLKEFVSSNMGWTGAQYDRWATTGDPDGPVE